MNREREREKERERERESYLVKMYSVSSRFRFCRRFHNILISVQVLFIDGIKCYKMM